MEFTAEMIAAFLDGEVVGDKNTKVWAMGKIEQGHEGEITFLSNPKYDKYIYDCGASIIIVNRSFTPLHPIKATLIKVENSYESLAKLLDLYASNLPQRHGISSQAFIAEGVEVSPDSYIGEFAVLSKGVKLGKNVKIYPQVYLGENVTIGDDTILYAGVKIYDNCSIGNRVILHSGVVIGADGFGFAPHEDHYKKIPQIGNAVIEDDVEIGANTCVDRATMGSTIVHRGVKLDNLIQIAHNVQVGEDTVMAAQCGVAGSTKVGKHCMFGGQCGLIGHLTIGDRVNIGSQSGVVSDIADGVTVFGYPAIPVIQSHKCQIYYRRLPDMASRLDKLEKQLAELTQK